MEPSKRPSAGIIVIAILALIGSALVLLMGLVMLAIPWITPIPQTPNAPFPPGFFKVMMALMSLFYLGLAVWGIVTSIGLFRLKEWARISMIVFSVLLIAISAFGGLMIMIIPFPTTPNQAADHTATVWVRAFMAAFWLFHLSIGVWWLVFFNRAKVKLQFGSLPANAAGSAPEVAYSASPLAPLPAAASRGPQRPLSLTIIAWLLLIGCLYLPANLFLRPPVLLFTKILTGWAASAYLLLVAAVSLYIGIGLLQLKPVARSVGVYFYSFFLANSMTFLLPGGSARKMEMLHKFYESYPWMKLPTGEQFDFPFDITPFLWIGFIVGVATLAVQLFFLITRKEAFERAAARAANAAQPGSPTSS